MKNLRNSSLFIAIYVEDSFNPTLNELITTHFDDITRQLNEVDVQFIYLPHVLLNNDIREIIGYNRPQLLQEFNQLSISDIYQKLKSDLALQFQGEGLIWIENRLHTQLKSFSLNAQDELHTQLHEFTRLIAQQPNPLDLYDEIYLYKENYETVILQDTEDYETFILQDTEYDSLQENKILCSHVDELHFETEAFELANEIREKIRKLEESGALYLLNDILEKVLVKKPQLSTLFITNDFRFFLKEYEMREVKMAPLSKALYLLFLRHPEGIKFKDLIDYRDELLSIYKNVTTHESTGKAMASIIAMTDPLNNSVNEKCSRIRAAFLEVIADELAQNYYVVGYKGEAKTITLDRSLVVFQ